MKTCETCKWWKPYDEKDPKSVAFDCGQCTSEKFAKDLIVWGDCFGDFGTPKTFGCIHHEDKK